MYIDKLADLHTSSRQHVHDSGRLLVSTNSIVFIDTSYKARLQGIEQKFVFFGTVAYTRSRTMMKLENGIYIHQVTLTSVFTDQSLKPKSTSNPKK